MDSLAPFQDKDQAPRRVCLGKITGAHGLKGLVKVLFFGDDVNALEDYGALYTHENAGEKISLTLKNSQGKYWLAEISRITDRTAAENLRGTELWIDRDKLPAPEDGQHYIEDLIGMDAVDESGTKIGKVIAIEDFGAGTLFEIQPAGGESFYVPQQPAHIERIDIQAGTVHLKDFKRFQI